MQPAHDSRRGSAGRRRDARRLEAGHLAQDAAGRLQQRPGQRGTGAFAQAQAEVEQRLCPEPGEPARVAALGGALPDAAFATTRPARGAKSCRTPQSTTVSASPCWRASTATAAPPAKKFSTICQVTSLG
jgi:hypothetical protein